MKASPERMLTTFRAAMSCIAREVDDDVELRVVEGAIPPEISGVLLRNGPGRSQRGGVAYGHPFDGDGFLQRLTLHDGRATWRGRYVRTREFVAEEAVDRILYRGFGTNMPGGLRTNALKMRFKNAANTSIVQHGGRALALWEGGLPHEVDPLTLETLGRYDFDGALRNTRSRIDAWLNPELPFAAHPTLDEETGELWSFGVAFGRVSRLLVHRVDPEGRLTTREVVLDALAFVHDFVLTRKYAIFVLPRVAFDVPRALLGLSTPVASLRSRPGPGRALLVPRDGSDVIEIPVEPGFVFHWASGRETDDGQLILEGVKYPGFPEFSGGDALFGPDGAPGLLARPVRLTLDIARRQSHEITLSDYAMELPQTQGSSGITFGTAAPPGRVQPFLSGIARLDASGAVRFRDFFPYLPGEPMPVGDVVLAPLFCGSAPSAIVLLDPEDLSTVARLNLPVAVPPPLHGVWIPGASG